MRVAVTGSSGQLGTQVLRRLLDDRAVESIVALDLRPPRLLGRKLRAVQADVRDAEIGKHLQGCDAAVHLAFIVAQQTPRGFVDSVNVGGSKNVFEAAAAAGIRTIVYTSSVAAYGVVKGHPDPIVEETPRKLQDGFPYAAAKFRVEEYLDEFEVRHPDLAVARLRPSILIGPGMEHPLGAALKRGYLPDFGAPSLPLVWNEDVADAIVLALRRRARGAFILSADEQLAAADLARAAGLRHVRVPRSFALALSRVSPLLARLGLMQPIDRAWIDGHDVELRFSSDKARTELGWKPRCNTSAEVMRKYVETVPGRLDRGIALLVRLIDLAARARPRQVDLKGFSSRIHLALTGRQGGDISITVHDQRLRVSQGAPVPPTAIVTLPAPLFLDLLAGRADFATAQLTGRIRVEGEGLAVMVFGGIVSQFRALSQQPGARGRIGRLLQRMIAGRPSTGEPRTAA
jgi:nucleoside-diphosphate-sugar epimerase/putative sterol carrier protein